MDFLTLYLLGLDNSIWGQTPVAEKRRYSTISIIFCGLITIGFIGMLFVGFSVINQWIGAVFISSFFTFLFFNIYRFAIISIDIKLGSIPKEVAIDTSSKSSNATNAPFKTPNVHFAKRLAYFFEFSFIVRTIVITLLGCIICFGWNLAIHWSSVLEFNENLSANYGNDHSGEVGIFLSKTAVYISNKGGFVVWLSIIVGSLLFGFRLKKNLVENPKFTYVRTNQLKNETIVAEDYRCLADHTNIYFKSNNIAHVFDNVWKNPPYRTEFKRGFTNRIDIGIDVLLKNQKNEKAGI